jgi:hypothetical protein
MKDLKNRAINIISMLRISRERIGNKSSNWISVLTQAMFYMNKVDHEFQDAVYLSTDSPLEPLRLNIQDFEACSQDRPEWTYDNSEEEPNEAIKTHPPSISTIPPKKRQSTDVVEKESTKTPTRIEPLKLSNQVIEEGSQCLPVRNDDALVHDSHQGDTRHLTQASSILSIKLIITDGDKRNHTKIPIPETSPENTKDSQQSPVSQIQSTQNTLSQIDVIIDSPNTAEFTKQVYQTQCLDIREFFHAPKSDNTAPANTSDDEVVPYHPSPTSELLTVRKITPSLYKEFTVNRGRQLVRRRRPAVVRTDRVSNSISTSYY